MKLCLDTNTYTALARGSRATLKLVREARLVYLTFITVAELRAGFRSGRKVSENERMLQRFLGSDRVNILYADEETTHHYASLYAQLRKQGTPIPTNDLWIGALSLQNNVTLCTLDRHFEHIAQLPRIVPV